MFIQRGWLETGTRERPDVEFTDICLLLDLIGTGLRKWDQRTKRNKIMKERGMERNVYYFNIKEMMGILQVVHKNGNLWKINIPPKKRTQMILK